MFCLNAVIGRCQKGWFALLIFTQVSTYLLLLKCKSRQPKTEKLPARIVQTESSTRKKYKFAYICGFRIQMVIYGVPSPANQPASQQAVGNRKFWAAISIHTTTSFFNFPSAGLKRIQCCHRKAEWLSMTSVMGGVTFLLFIMV